MRGKQLDKIQVIEVLRPYLELGMSITEACNSAGIPQSTIATWTSKDEELRLIIAGLQNITTTKAIRLIVKKIEEGDIKTAKWWLERKEKAEFSLRPTEDKHDMIHDIQIIIGEENNSEGEVSI